MCSAVEVRPRVLCMMRMKGGVCKEGLKMGHGDCEGQRAETRPGQKLSTSAIGTGGGQGTFSKISADFKTIA